MRARQGPSDCFHRILWDCDHPGFVELFRELDPPDFVRQVRAAGFECVGFFARDSLGQSLYPTDIGHRHPGLFRDFLGEMTAAAQAEGLTVIAYVNATQDPWHARTRPEWAERSAGEREGVAAEAALTGPFVCLHGGYADAVLIPQLREIAARYPVDGIFLDFCCEPHSRRLCACARCREEYARDLQRGLPGPSATQAEWLAYSRWRKARHWEVQQRVLDAVHAARPGLAVTVNYAFSARQPDPPQGVDYLSLDVEEHTNPLLGVPSYLRYGARLGLPIEVFVSHMQHWWWDWDLRPLAAMQLQAAEILANGGLVTVGSNLHPGGRLDPRVMAQLKTFNDFVRERAPFCCGARPWANVAVLHSAAALEARSAVGYSHASGMNALVAFRGIARVLLEGHVPFQFVHEFDVPRQPDAFPLLVLPEQAALPEETVAAIVRYVEEGGCLLAIGETATNDGAGRRHGGGGLDELLGVRSRGLLPYPCAYGQFRPDAAGPRSGPLLLEGPWMRVEAAGARVLADLVEPCHGATADEDYVGYGVGLPPPGQAVVGAAVTIRDVGRGRAAYVAGPVCTQHGAKTQLEWRDVVLWLVRPLLPEPLIETDAPPTVEIALARQPGRILCHVVNYANEKGYSLRQLPEFVPPLFDLGITVRAPAVERVRVEPEGRSLPFTRSGDRISFRLPRLDLHVVVVLEP